MPASAIACITGPKAAFATNGSADTHETEGDRRGDLAADLRRASAALRRM